MNREALDRILRHYPERVRSLEPVARDAAEGFSGAAIVRLRGPDGDFCLRGWPEGALSRPRLQGLHALLQWVFAAGVEQVAVPLSTSEGGTLITWQGRDWQLEPWMPGRADFQSAPSEARLRAAMRCLAAWHAAAARFAPDPSASEWFASRAESPSPAVRERLDLLRRWRAGGLDRLRARIEAEVDLEPEPTQALRPAGRHSGALEPGTGDGLERRRELCGLARRLLTGVLPEAPRVEADLRTAARLTFPVQPCLRDVWHDHVLFTGNEVTGLIDANACRTDNVATDLARLLGSLIDDDRRRWSVALEAYASDRPLSLDELGLVPVLDRSGVLLSALTWLERFFLRAPHSVPCERVLQRLRWLAGRIAGWVQDHAL